MYSDMLTTVPHFKITVGLFLFSVFRDFLKQEQFKGSRIEWVESTGWISRTFTVKGEDAIMVREKAILAFVD
jgi:hypothetical protein